MVPVLEGGAAVGPAVLGWSTTSTGHAVRVSARPAATILMLVPDVVDACVASGALVQNTRLMLSQAHQSRPVPPTERDRRAFPHGKAFPGRGAPFPPAWCTAGAVRAVTRPVPEAAPTQNGRSTASLGARLVGPTQLAGPGPVVVLIGCVYRNGKALRAKVNVRDPARRRTSLQSVPQCLPPTIISILNTSITYTSKQKHTAHALSS